MDLKEEDDEAIRNTLQAGFDELEAYNRRLHRIPSRYS